MAPSNLTEAGWHLMAAGVILLGDVATRTDSITVVCRLCNGAGDGGRISSAEHG
jgi:hypothetical protein